MKVQALRSLLGILICASLFSCTPGEADTAATPTEEEPTQVQETGKTILTLSYEVKPNPPYYLGSGTEIDWERPGIVVELFKSLEDNLDVEIHFVRNPWQRGLNMLAANEVDGVFNASFKAERMEIGVYPMRDGQVDTSRRTFTNAYYFYKLADSPVEWDGNTFGNLDGQVGAVTGYAIVGSLEEMGVDVFEGANQLDNLRMLAQGRLAGVAGIGTMNDMYLEEYPDELSGIVQVEIPLAQKEYYLIFSHQFIREHPQLAQDIWDEIGRLRESGEYDKIANKYLE